MEALEASEHCAPVGRHHRALSDDLTFDIWRTHVTIYRGAP